jgi:hypothetical protein
MSESASPTGINVTTKFRPLQFLLSLQTKAGHRKWRASSSRIG